MVRWPGSIPGYAAMPILAEIKICGVMDMDKIIVDIEQAFDFLPFLNFDNVSIQIDNGDIQPVKDIRWFRNHYRVEYRYKAGQYRYYPNEHEINLVMFP